MECGTLRVAAVHVATTQILCFCTASTPSGNPSSYEAVFEANESGRPAVGKLGPFHPGLVVILAVRGSHLKGGLCTAHVPV
jgi:hypothetical protein